MEKKPPHYLYFFACVSSRVFVFADRAVFPETLLNAVRADVECGALGSDTLTPQRWVLLHTLQAGLGKECHGRQLTQALEVCSTMSGLCVSHFYKASDSTWLIAKKNYKLR